jgi:hypothetical protein
MTTCFGLPLDHLQANVHKRYNQCVLCIVGPHITYRVQVRAMKIMNVFVKVKTPSVAIIKTSIIILCF